MSQAEMRKQMEFARKKTLDLLDSIAKLPDAAAILAWRPGPGRAHIAWQFMHVGATDDRHLNVRVRGGVAKEPENERRFAGGSTPDDTIPTVEEIRRYLTIHRTALLDMLDHTTDDELAKKPYEASPYTLAEWFRVWAWHEAHHQGQAHLTLNMYRAAQPK
ncbi:MAG: DinB family protein [Planctomycetes bacterium]|nr:DinB family protein [Planctomycetota bacterium]